MDQKKKNKSVYICDQCGNESINWSGRCQYCGSWNTLKELKISQSKNSSNILPTEVLNYDEKLVENEDRITSGILEFDRVLGGGLVPGSMILFAGEPGIGKSTLLSQVAAKLKDTLYISAEESVAQISSRFKRLLIKNNSITLATESDLDKIIALIEKRAPKILIIDSIQTIGDSSISSSVGSIIQVKESATRIQNIIKSRKITTIIVGHVTKGGEVAGPRTLEHLVDVVVYLEGERYHDGRILRCVKNRFGPTDEVGVFKITDLGLIEVKNPSEIFLAEYDQSASGVAVAVTLEGTRPILVEVQALVAPTNFGYPKRTAVGYDLNRLNIIIAILGRRTKINLQNYDVYLNIAGGIKISEPAIDLGVAVAVASAYKDHPLPKGSCFYGELGLSGEIRRVLKEERRDKEAKNLGFSPVKGKKIDQLINSVV